MQQLRTALSLIPQEVLAPVAKRLYAFKISTNLSNLNWETPSKMPSTSQGMRGTPWNCHRRLMRLLSGCQMRRTSTRVRVKQTRPSTRKACGSSGSIRTQQDDWPMLFAAEMCLSLLIGIIDQTVLHTVLHTRMAMASTRLRQHSSTSAANPTAAHLKQALIVLLATQRVARVLEDHVISVDVICRPLQQHVTRHQESTCT